MRVSPVHRGKPENLAADLHDVNPFGLPGVCWRFCPCCRGRYAAHTFVIREEALLFPFDLGYVRGFSFLGGERMNNVTLIRVVAGVLAVVVVVILAFRMQKKAPR